MRWLIWKEYRLNRLVLIAGATLLILPHAVILMLAWYELGPSVGGMPLWSGCFFFSSLQSVAVAQLTMVLLGGNAIACERLDRSAEFLAYLPISKRRTLAGKLALALLTAALIWVPNMLILLLATRDLPELRTARDFQMMWEIPRYVALTGLLWFCVGWLLSSIAESPTFAICVGLISPALVLLGIEGLGWALGYSLDETTVGSWYRWTCLGLAAACFVAGTWYYLRRVEP